MPKESTYEKLLKKHISEMKIEKGTIHHIEVHHDEWCAHFDGGECDCEPFVFSGPAIQRKYGESA